MELSTKSNNLWVARLTAKFLNVFCLILVIWTVCFVTQSKLDYLRETSAVANSTHASAADTMKQLDCLTKNIYWEAASEPFEGKVGVAQVTLNRVESGKFADTVCGVVHQKNVFYEKVICQFSWYCENTFKTKKVHTELWKESEEVAKKVLLEKFRLPSLTNALYYHADYVHPNWHKPKITQIGRHIFYGDRT